MFALKMKSNLGINDVMTLPEATASNTELLQISLRFQGITIFPKSDIPLNEMLYTDMIGEPIARFTSDLYKKRYEEA